MPRTGLPSASGFSEPTPADSPEPDGAESLEPDGAGSLELDGADSLEPDGAGSREAAAPGAGGASKPGRNGGDGRRGKRRRPPGARLFRFDRQLGARFVAGADEAGRGCLAGPLVAAAVLFDYERLSLRDLRSLSSLNDSKQHTAEAREALYPRVLRAATRVAVTSRCARGIDERGLHKTNLAALRDVLARVGCDGCLCLSDGFPVPATGFEQRPVVGGDATSAAIAAASVIAKVTRDRFMQRMEARYPGWEFATHVGYSTPEHRAAIERHGVSPLHRLSFQSMAYQQLAL